VLNVYGDGRASARIADILLTGRTATEFVPDALATGAM
jgi:hypothetical protein